MRKKGAGLLPLCMLVLLAAGALMPSAASALLDRNLAAQIETRPLKGVQLTVRQDGGVERTLRVLAANCAEIELREGKRLTGQEAALAGREALELLMQAGLLPDFSPLESAGAVPFAAIPGLGGGTSTVMSADSAGGADTAVVWECAFAGEGGVPSCTVRIDDATGKLVSVGYLANGRTSASSDAAFAVELEKEPLARRWGSFLQDYYGLAPAAVEKAYRNESERAFTLEFTWMEGEAPDSCKLPLTFRGDDVFFCR